MAKKTKPDLRKELREEFSRWKHLYEEGGSDPFWSDGVNMNLVRNHILYTKKRIEEEVENNPDFVCPPEYHLKTPPEAPMNYMAKAGQIYEDALRILPELEQNEDYLFLKNNMHLADKTTEQIFRPVRWINGFRLGFDAKDLVSLRRCLCNTDYYKEELTENRKKWEDLHSATMPEEELNIVIGEQMSFVFA